MSAHRELSTLTNWVLAVGGLFLLVGLAQLARTRTKPRRVRSNELTPTVLLLPATAALLNAAPRVAGAPEGVDVAATALGLISIAADAMVFVRPR